MNLFQVTIYLCVLTSVTCIIFNPEEEGKIKGFVEGVMDCQGIPGLTLVVVKGSESWTHGYGMADRENRVPVTPSTLFGIGSLTKAFTSTLLAMLINDTNGRLSWTSKVKDILGPEFAFVDEERTRETTLRDLLVHRTGLITADFTIYHIYNVSIPRSEFTKRIRFLPEGNPFRNGWEYNNWMYSLAGNVVEVLSGETWENTLQKRILDPLGMTSTFVFGQTATTTDAGVAKPYVNIENELVLTDPTIYSIHPYEAAGAIAASAEDMVRWTQFLMRGGRLEDNTSLVDPKILGEVFVSHQGLSQKEITKRSYFHPTFPVSDLSYGYGYAWFIGSYRGYRKYWHSGGLHAYISYFNLYPDLDTAVFVSTNGPGVSGTGKKLTLIQNYVTDIILGEIPWLNTTTACSFPAPWETTPAKPVDETITNREVKCPSCYTGTYGHQLYGNLEVKVEPGSNVLMMNYGKLKGTLNSTDDQLKFKLDALEPFRFFSRPGNKTSTAPAVFSEMVDGAYQRIDIVLPYPTTFLRNVSFADEIVTVTTSGQNSIVSQLSVFVITLLVCINLIFKNL